MKLSANSRRSKIKIRSVDYNIILLKKNHKYLKIWLMLIIFTINDVEKNIYIYKNENKHSRGYTIKI